LAVAKLVENCLAAAPNFFTLIAKTAAASAAPGSVAAS
jgi:hypothetical protein